MCRVSFNETNFDRINTVFKDALFIFWVTGRKWTDFNNFSVQNREKISRKNIVNIYLRRLNNVAALLYEIQK